MLRIATKVAPSLIEGAGVGLFCLEKIIAGTLVWMFDDGLDIRLPFLPDDPVMREFVATYGYLQADGVPGYVLCLDNARFVNHADLSDATLIVDLDGTCYAARDLLPGTELTHSYDTFCAVDPQTGWKVGDGAFPSGKLVQGQG